MSRAVYSTAVAAAALCSGLSIAKANDTMAELAAGGLTFVRALDVDMASEDLFISPSEVRVNYVFRNSGDQDRTTVVAFPMPDIEGSGDFMVSVPNPDSDNFMDFEVSIEGKPVTPNIDRHVFAADVEVTDELTTHKIPLLPFGDTTINALGALPKSVLDDWVQRGIVLAMEYDDGSGWQTDYAPAWKLKTTYWWRTTFPAGRDLKVAHRYKPSVGATSGLNFLNYDDDSNPLSGPSYEKEKQRFCFDDTFAKAVKNRLDEAKAKESYLYEHWISYILTTGGNWGGAIGKFHLTVDKEKPNSIISFCGDGVRKTGPTTFEMTAEDFYPERDLHIALIIAAEDEQLAPP